MRGYRFWKREMEKKREHSRKEIKGNVKETFLYLFFHVGLALPLKFPQNFTTQQEVGLVSQQARSWTWTNPDKIPSFSFRSINHISNRCPNHPNATLDTGALTSRARTSLSTALFRNCTIASDTRTHQIKHGNCQNRPRHGIAKLLIATFGTDANV